MIRIRFDIDIFRTKAARILRAVQAARIGTNTHWAKAAAQGSETYALTTMILAARRPMLCVPGMNRGVATVSARAPLLLIWLAWCVCALCACKADASPTDDVYAN